MKMFTGNAILPKLDGIYRFLRWVLGGIFIYSGTTKLLAPKTFAVLIEAYGLVPDGMILPVAVILPFLEVVGGAGLLVDIRGCLAVVIYCGFVKCTRSHNGAAWAVKLGYKNVYRYSGGVFAWKGAKYPLEKVE
jgi:uncharacterized membrane protein YphA (DoxX/SURF4 family)